MVRIFLKNILKDKELVFKNGIKDIQVAVYNGAHTVLIYVIFSHHLNLRDLEKMKKHKIPPKPKKLWVPTREQCELWPTTLVNKRHLCNHRKFVKQETFWSFSTVWRRPCIRSVLFLNNDKILFYSHPRGHSTTTCTKFYLLSTLHP